MGYLNLRRAREAIIIITKPVREDFTLSLLAPPAYWIPTSPLERISGKGVLRHPNPHTQRSSSHETVSKVITCWTASLQARTRGWMTAELRNLLKFKAHVTTNKDEAYAVHFNSQGNVPSCIGTNKEYLVVLTLNDQQRRLWRDIQKRNWCIWKPRR